MMDVLLVGALYDFLSPALTQLCARGYRLVQVDSPAKALEALQRSTTRVSTLLIDVSEDIPAFMDLLKKQAGAREDISVIACSTGTLEKERVRQVLEAGVDDFIPFPPDPHLIADLFDSFHKKSATQALLFKDPVMDSVIAMADRIAKSDASILITGESGTGKEVMARYIHEKSRRSKKAFVSVNCAAIPETLLESELFGHEKGAFTGAIKERKGKFEEAGGGTMLMDEISEMDPRLQAKLLRAIQEKQVDRLGGKGPISVDFRLISTSNCDMQQVIRAGTFREDLFFRISVVHLHLPPLRQRPADIAMLAEHFIQRYAKADGLKKAPRLSKEAVAFLADYAWPGNVRELQNAMHRGVLLAEGGVIGQKHIWPQDTTAAKPANPDGARDQNAQERAHLAALVGWPLQVMEQHYIQATLAFHKQDIDKAAKVLEIAPALLQEKVQESTTPRSISSSTA